MPDYYLVAGPETIEGTWRHWWLRRTRPPRAIRVLPVEASGAALRARLRPSLRPGRGPTWPGCATCSSRSRDRVGLRDQPGAA